MDKTKFLITVLLDCSTKLVKIIIKGSSKKIKAVELKLLTKIIKDNIVVKRIKVVVLLLSLVLINRFHIKTTVRGIKKVKKRII